MRDIGAELGEFVVLVGDRFISVTMVARKRASTSSMTSMIVAAKEAL
ncbi:hypothetical protein [Kibdelosporangium aridum]